MAAVAAAWAVPLAAHPAAAVVVALVAALAAVGVAGLGVSAAQGWEGGPATPMAPQAVSLHLSGELPAPPYQPSKSSMAL